MQNFGKGIVTDMKKLRIFVDMDGTIENLLDVWVDRLNAAYGMNLEPDDIKVWDLMVAYKGLTREQVLAPTHDDSIWKDVRPYENAPEVLKRLIDAGHEIYIVTSTPHTSVRAKMDDLLFRWFPFISWKNVVIADHKQLLKGDLMIDDGVHNLEGGDYEKFLFDAPYNRSYNAEANGMTRVYNWLEVEEKIKEMLE